MELIIVSSFLLLTQMAYCQIIYQGSQVVYLSTIPSSTPATWVDLSTVTTAIALKLDIGAKAASVASGGVDLSTITTALNKIAVDTTTLNTNVNANQARLTTSTPTFGGITTDNLVASDMKSSRFHPPMVTSTTMHSNIVVSKGDEFRMMNALGTPYSTCFATGTFGSSLVFSSAPLVACRNSK